MFLYTLQINCGTACYFSKARMTINCSSFLMHQKLKRSSTKNIQYEFPIDVSVYTTIQKYKKKTNKNETSVNNFQPVGVFWHLSTSFLQIVRSKITALTFHNFFLLLWMNIQSQIMLICIKFLVTIRLDLCHASETCPKMSRILKKFVKISQFF